MGANNFKCCTDPNFAQNPVEGYSKSTSLDYAEEATSSSSLKINEFQLCKKGEIHQEKIGI